MSHGGRSWAKHLARLSLLAWPPEARRKHGRSAARAVLEEFEARRAGGRRSLGWLGAELLAMTRSGLGLRWRSITSAVQRWSGGLRADGRVAIRSLLRAPGFTLTVVATLAVGVGGTAVVIGLVDRVLFAPPPYDEPHRLGLVWNNLGSDPGRIRVAAPDVDVFRARTPSLDGIAFVNHVTDASLGVRDDDAVTHVRVATASHDLFHVLGVEPVLGRAFDAGDGPEGSGELVVLVSNRLWRTRLGADPAAIGRSVRINGVAAMVVGVLAEDFRLELPPDAGIATDADVWEPLTVPLADFHRDEGRRLDQDSDNTGVAIARLRPGATFSSAGAELERTGAYLRELVPSYRTADLRVVLRPLQEDARQHLQGVTTILSAGALVLLLVTSLNIATLVLARGARRRRELSVRLALGSGRVGVVRALTVENVFLVVLGAVVAIPLSGSLTTLLAGSLPSELSAGLAGGLRVSPFVVAGAGLALVLVTALGAAPAVRMADAGSFGALRDRGGSGGRVRAGLVGAQLALSVALMTSAVLIASAADRIRDQRPGFDARGALTFSVSLRAPGRYSGPADRARLLRELESTIQSLPDARAVGVLGGLPLSGERWTQSYGLPGQAEHEWPQNRADFRVVTSGLFDALGIRLLEGRTFTREEDLIEDRRVVIVDRALADRVAPAGGSAVGRTLGFPLDGDAVQAEIVGVVERVRYDDPATFGREALYVPYRQEASRDVSFVVRTEDGSAAAVARLAASVREVIQEIDSQIPVFEVRSMTDWTESALAPVRFALRLVGAFALLTLLAASLGVYGVVAFEASSRARDLGLRLAVGASSRDVRRLMVLRGLRVGAAGGTMGLVLCGIGIVMLGDRLPDLAATDPLAWAIGGISALALTLLASWWPAWRVSRMDPAMVLRSE